MTDREELARKIIEKVEVTAKAGMAGFYVRQVPSGLDYGQHWPIMAAIAVFEEESTTLADASSVPEPGVSPSNAAEFAALWNTRTPEQREKLVQVLLDQQERAHKCFMEDHEGLKQQLQGSEQARLAGEQKLAGIQQALIDFGVAQGVVHPTPESWSTEQTHQDCQHCEAAVEDAIIHAKATGSVEATYTHTTPQPRGDGYSELKHVGTVKRSA